MIATRKLSSFFLAFLFAALVGCGSSGGGDPVDVGGGGGDGGGDGGGAGGSSDAPDVEIEQLAGSWFGTFDTKTAVRTFQFTVEGSSMTEISLDGTDTNLTGELTKATEAPRTYRFTINNSGGELARGMILVDPSATYIAYLDQNFDFGVLQKDATEHPTYEQADVDKAWVGDTVTTTEGFTTFTSQASSATCAPTDPATDPATSQCSITLGDTARTATGVALDHERGRWLGDFTQEPPADAAPNTAIRAYLSPDKNFAGVWTCHDFVGGFPASCDFSSWTVQ